MCLAEGGATGAAIDGTPVPARDAAVMRGGGACGADKDIGGDMAVLDGTTIVPRYAADIMMARDVGISEGNIPDSAVNVAEETLKVIRRIDSDAADGMALAVEDTIERPAPISDARKVVLLAVGVVPDGSSSWRRT